MDPEKFKVLMESVRVRVWPFPWPTPGPDPGPEFPLDPGKLKQLAAIRYDGAIAIMKIALAGLEKEREVIAGK
jgi:hypothetical protein